MVPALRKTDVFPCKRSQCCFRKNFALVVTLFLPALVRTNYSVLMEYYYHYSGFLIKLIYETIADFRVARVTRSCSVADTNIFKTHRKYKMFKLQKICCALISTKEGCA